ncbi:MAG: major facilitator superfamily domain-containing protein [Benjaminiella poitrasii]|nr:MAG: major facilitator superfamily domain-containing protein [Benjaminiella poitrasii]
MKLFHQQKVTTVGIDPELSEKPYESAVTSTEKKKPFLFKFRSSDIFVFSTAAVGLFTSTFVHSILFPLSPFIVARIRNLDREVVDHSKSSAITENIEMTSRDTGILVALYAVGLLIGSPIFGWLGDRIKQRRLPMLLGTTASIAANVLFMLSTTYSMLLVARVLQGISNACVWTMCLCLVADNWPRDQLGSQMGKLVGFYPLGMMVGLPAGVLYSEIGHEAPFIASMILSGIDLIMRLVIVERSSSPKEWFESNHEDSTNIQTDNDISNDLPKTRVTWLQLLKQPRLIVSLALTAVVATVMSAFEPTLSMRLAEEWEFNAAGCSLIVLAYMVPSIIASAVCGWLCDQYGTKIVALISLLMATPFCLLIGYPSQERGTFWPLVPILIMGGITIAGCQAPVFPEIANVVDKENGNSTSSDGLARSYSLFNAAYGVGMCVGPLMGGYLYASIGFFWLCTILSSFFFCFLPLAYFYIGQDRHLITRKCNPTDDTLPMTTDNKLCELSNKLITMETDITAIAIPEESVVSMSTTVDDKTEIIKI